MATKRFFSRDDVLAAVLIDENSDSEDSYDEDEEGIGAYIGPELPDSELVDDYDDVETVHGGTKDVVNSPQDPQDVVNSPRDVVNSLQGTQDVVNSPPDPQDVVNSLEGPQDVINSLKGPQDVVNSLEGPQDVVNSHDDAITEESEMEVEGITGDLSNSKTMPVIDMKKWKKCEPSYHTYKYCAEPGPTTPTLLDTPALEYLQLFFTDDVWELLVSETNRYAFQIDRTSPTPRHWEEVTIKEMKAFFGLVIIMGIIQLPRLEMFWQLKHPLLRCPCIAEVMTKTRFEQILRFLHLVDNKNVIPIGNEGHDKLFKIRPFLDLLSYSFQQEYTPNENVVVDEAMIPFKGRISFLQYMKDKPTKWGIKVYVLADSTNGYVYRFQIYTGKQVNENSSSMGLCTRVVLDLMSGLEDQHFKLYTDNYYTSPSLFTYLYENGINACGTARTNRKGFPKDIVIGKRKVNRGSYDYRSNGPLLACSWFDKRAVYFLSTNHPAMLTNEELPTVKRWHDKRERVDISCPPLLSDYISFMRGVDRGDQLLELYNFGRRSQKWWKRVFFYLLEVCVLNAYILEGFVCEKHKLHGHAKRDLLAFKIDLAEQLIGGFRGRKRPGRQCHGPSTDMARLNLALGHFPEFTERPGDCFVCNTLGKRQKLDRRDFRARSCYVCSYCQVHLCIGKKTCFNIYHTKLQYWT